MECRQDLTLFDHEMFSGSRKMGHSKVQLQIDTDNVRMESLVTNKDCSHPTNQNIQSNHPNSELVLPIPSVNALYNLHCIPWSIF